MHREKKIYKSIKGRWMPIYTCIYVCMYEIEMYRANVYDLDMLAPRVSGMQSQTPNMLSVLY